MISRVLAFVVAGRSLRNKGKGKVEMSTGHRASPTKVAALSLFLRLFSFWACFSALCVKWD